ncbi:MAG TPA: hydantoinase/carbamoylase family amidase [Candidatus Sulfotelmatobacter sp.]|nr:hydantoinase/carbamoylase family amidase [Candidatus Sulfotelmatobacter sp.]
MPEIDPQRLIGDLRRLAEFGRHGTGVHRLSLSAEDVAARRWLRDRMAAAGLDARIDGVGNVFGRSRAPGPVLLMGSHTDTQPKGGWLDGAMGVIYGLEVARALAADPACRDIGVDVASWIDEEGHFPIGFLGSRAFAGELDPADVAGAKGRDGVALADALRTAGLDGAPVIRLEPGRYTGYLEAHVEQGGTLERDQKRIGVVTAIVGIRGGVAVFTGEQNHAGTTPMPLRKDAGVALFEFASKLGGAFKDVAGPDTVWTFGKALLEPGSPSVIPGHAELTLQYRDPDTQRLDALEAALTALLAETNAAGPCRVAMTQPRRTEPAPMDAGFQDLIARAGERRAPGLVKRLHSAAGHDAMVLSRHMRSAMLFVPSIRGISHDVAEDTSEADLVLGCQVAADAAAAILRA